MAKWHAHSAFTTKLTNSTPSSVRYGGCLPSSSRHSRSVRPERSSCAARQTISGRSPGCGMNSKSCSQISSKGRSIGVTRRPLFEERMFGAIHEAALVAERQFEDPRLFELGPDRICEASGRRGEDLVALVLEVGEEPDPFGHTLYQADLLGACGLVLLAVVVGQPNRHNAYGAAGCDGEIQNVVGHRDADPVQGRHHFFRYGEELPFHADFQVNHGNDRPELGMGAEELVLSWCFADRDGNDTSGTLALHAGKVPAHGAELLLFLIQLLLVDLRYAACGIGEGRDRGRRSTRGDGVDDGLDRGVDQYGFGRLRTHVQWSFGLRVE